MKMIHSYTTPFQIKEKRLIFEILRPEPSSQPSPEERAKAKLQTDVPQRSMEIGNMVDRYEAQVNGMNEKQLKDVDVNAKTNEVRNNILAPLRNIMSSDAYNPMRTDGSKIRMMVSDHDPLVKPLKDAQDMGIKRLEEAQKKYEAKLDAIKKALDFKREADEKNISFKAAADLLSERHQSLLQRGPDIIKPDEMKKFNEEVKSLDKARKDQLEPIMKEVQDISVKVQSLPESNGLQTVNRVTEIVNTYVIYEERENTGIKQMNNNCKLIGEAFAIRSNANFLSSQPGRQAEAQAQYRRAKEMMEKAKVQTLPDTITGRPSSAPVAQSTGSTTAKKS